MKYIITLFVAVSFASPAWCEKPANDLGTRDILRVQDTDFNKGELRMAVQVQNDQHLGALDIPLRFGRSGDPITLIDVEWTERVKGWDLTHAAIDNENKTVILGLISDLMGTRRDSTLKIANSINTSVATLVFAVQGDFRPSIETFTTERPYHALTFIYDKNEGGKRRVKEFAPLFGTNLSYKQSSVNVPKMYALSQNFPNPFNPTTSFTLSLPEASDYSIRIFNIKGQIVKTFAGHLEAGNHSITWDGSNDQGSKVASGVYFYKVDAKQFTETRKMMMLK